MRFDSSFVRANDLRFAYVEQGARDGLPILLLHGYSDTHRSFDLLRAHLPEARRVIALTQRGHGRSDKPQGGYAIPDFASDVPAILDALGIARAIIVGHSMGGAIALQAAADNPERCAGLVLLNAFADFRTNPGIGELADVVPEFTDPIDPEFVLEFQESCFNIPIPQRFLDMIIAESLRCPAHVWRGAFAGMIAFDPLDAAQRVRAPALVLRGELDAFVPHGDLFALRDALPSARAFTLTGVGHTPHWEQPRDTAQRLIGFVSELEDCGGLLDED